ncbi:MAG: ABC transporter permease [Halodesulfurarchaeum sp.]
MIYDLYGPGIGTVAFGFDPRALDWLVALSIAILGWYGVGGLLANPMLARRYWEGIKQRPEALASLIFLTIVAVLGVLGPEIQGPLSLAPAEKFQPPVFLSTDTSTVSQCVGHITGGVCHGTWQYPLGTDKMGRDLLTLLAYGARVAILLAAVSGAIIVPIAVMVGLVSGYMGGWVDDVLMRYVDVQQTVPAIIVYLMLILVFGESLFLIVVVFGLLSWGEVARHVRTDVLRFRKAEHVLAAEGIGASRAYVIRKHILPRASPTVIAATTRKTPEIILIQAALAFLNLNDVMVPSWGHTIANGLSDFWVAVPHKWWVSTIPVIALAGTIVSLNVLGNTFREVLDPRSLE